MCRVGSSRTSNLPFFLPVVSIPIKFRAVFFFSLSLSVKRIEMTSLLRTPTFPQCPLPSLSTKSLDTQKRFSTATLCYTKTLRLKQYRSLSLSNNNKISFWAPKLTTTASASASGETTETSSEVEVEVDEEVQEEILENLGETSGDEVPLEDTSDEEAETEDKPPSVIVVSLQSYKEALANNDEAKIAEIEAFFQSIEDEKNSLANKLATLSNELSSERERVLRIGADFDNFRKRTDRERLSLVTNAQGEVIESLLGVLDNFERAKSQIKVETEGEEKINNSYQSIYKQFVEILGSLGVAAVETVGNPFDPMLHEAIMREDSSEFEESMILQEFRKGFKLGDRLLRPSMVKVSAGPGPAKPKEDEPTEDTEGENETAEENTTEGDST